jgi:hypothetical protein
MKTFPVEARAAEHVALVRVTDQGLYVYAVFLAADHEVLIRGGGLDGELTSPDDLVAAAWDLIDFERDPDLFRAIRAEGHARRFTEPQRRILDRVAI